MCHRHSRIGWVYRCTQDHDGALPESEFVIGMNDSVTITSSDNPAVDGLSSWIMRAIQDGHYTPEQIEVVESQRLGVKHAIAALQEQQAAKLSRHKETYETAHSKQSAISSNIVELNLHLRTITEEVDLAEKRSPIYTPPCRWKSCHNCRPTFRDRTYLSLDAVAANEVTAAPPWEMNNRRSSDLRVCRGLGLRKIGRACGTFDDLSCRYSVQSMEAVVENASDDADTDDSDEYIKPPERGRRLRDSFRNVIRDTLRPFPDRSASPTRSVDHSQSRISTKLKEWARCSRDSPYASGSHSSMESTNSTMIDAMNTPLPEAANDMDDLGGGEVETEDGLAVKEEGVGLSTADIILQI